MSNRKPEISKTPDGYLATWDDGVSASVEEIREHGGDELKAYVIIRSETLGPLKADPLNLLASTTKAQWVRILQDRAPDVDWHAKLDQLAVGVRELYRSGEPTIDMRLYPDDDGPVWHLEPFIGTEGPTVLFGDGGMGKSTIAIAILATAAGTTVLGQAYQTGPALFLDYEGTARGFRTRLAAICEGAGLAIPEIHYRREYASLPEAAPAIRREIARLGVCTVAIDSVGLACGGSPEAADVTLAFFTAVDSLRVPAILVDHITKNGGQEQTKAYGSVYKHNRPRLAWRVVSRQDENGRRLVALTEHKHNDFGEIRPLTYRMAITTDERRRWRTVEFQPADARTEADVADMILKGRARIWAAIRQAGRGLKVEEVAAEVDQPVETVSRTLRRYRGKIFYERDGVWWNQES